MRTVIPTALLGATLLLAGCGGTASPPVSSGTPPSPSQAAQSTAAAPSKPASAAPSNAPANAPASTRSSASGAAAPAGSIDAAALQSATSNLLASAEASLPGGKFACGQMANAPQRKGQVLITVPQIEDAIGFKVSLVFWNANAGGVTDCRYEFTTPAGGARLEFGIDENTATAKDDFAARQANHFSLFPGSVISEPAPVSGLGDSAYKAKLDGTPTDLHVLKGPIYFEIASESLKEERLLKMAQAVAQAVQ